MVDDFSRFVCKISKIDWFDYNKLHTSLQVLKVLHDKRS